MHRFGTSLVRRRASRMISEFINGLGPVAVQKILDTGKPLSEMLPPEKLAQYQGLAHEYAWAADAITDQELMTMIPPWAMAMVKAKGPAGEKWLQEQITWVRGLFV